MQACTKMESSGHGLEEIPFVKIDFMDIGFSDTFLFKFFEL